MQSRHQGVTSHAHALAPKAGLQHPHQSAVTHKASGTQAGGPVLQVATAKATVHRSRVHLTARAGLQKIEVASLQSYNAAANTAMVRILGTQSNLIGPLPLGEGLSPGLAVPGATCLVVLLDEANPADAAIVAIYNAPPQPWSQAGSANLALGGYQLAQTVTFPAAFATSVLGITASSRHPDYVASVSGETTSGFVLTLTRREGAGQLQYGALSVPVATGAAAGSAALTFPSAFAVARSAAATSMDGNWQTSVSSLTAAGCLLAVSSRVALGPASITVYWQAMGDPLVNANVTVDWCAVGI